METRKAKDLMVPLEEYATVSEHASLVDAVTALERAQQLFDRNHYPHRAILVFDRNGKIVGKLSQRDVLRGLDPELAKHGPVQSVLGRARDAAIHYGFSKAWIGAMLTELAREKPLDELCDKAADIRVRDIMYTPGEREYVSEDTGLNEAIKKLVRGGHQSLLVTRRRDVVGVLRLTDVFAEACRLIRACRP
jgi:CBS domain-containing protein